MTLYPIDPALMKSYRDTLAIAGSPSFIDDEVAIVPVAIVAQTSTESASQFVKVTDGTDTLVVATEGTIGVTQASVLGPQGTSATVAKWGTATGAGTGDVTLYTVTTGKTFYALGFHFSNGSSSQVTLIVKDATTTRWNTFMQAGASAPPQFGNQINITIPWPGMPFTTSVIVNKSGATDANLNVFGYETA